MLPWQLEVRDPTTTELSRYASGVLSNCSMETLSPAGTCTVEVLHFIHITKVLLTKSGWGVPKAVVWQFGLPKLTLHSVSDFPRAEAIQPPTPDQYHWRLMVPHPGKQFSTLQSTFASVISGSTALWWRQAVYYSYLSFTDEEAQAQRGWLPDLLKEVQARPDELG